MSFGVLTLATPADYQKAIGLALSLRVSNPSVPIAVACGPDVRSLVSPFFDFVIEEDLSLRGFVHKIHLDRYSPFEETFFFDSDVLVFRPLAEVIEHWRGRPYTACGNYLSDGSSAFGLDRQRVLQLIKRDRLVHIDGAGHAYFQKPDCHEVFDLGRHVVANFSHYAGQIKFADEDVMDIVMTILGLEPVPHIGFWSRYCSGKPSSIRMDASIGLCSYEAVATGEVERPVMMHFAANEAPFVYQRQLRGLFNKFHISTKGLMLAAIEDFFVGELKWPLKRLARRSLDGLRRRVGPG
jgi:hypothetical protein